MARCLHFNPANPVFGTYWGGVVGVSVGILRNLYPHRRVLRVTASMAVCALLLVLGVWSRQLNYAASRQAYFYLDIAGCFLCFFYAVNGMVRFRRSEEHTSELQ